MSELEKKLANALNRLMFSADHYIEDGSWIEVLHTDIQTARKTIELYKQVKKQEVSRAL